MPSSAVPVFERTVQLTHAWLKDLCDRLGWEDQHRAYFALRATLHALRDRLTINEAAHLGAQLPMLVRGFYYEGWHPAGTPDAARTIDEFLASVRHAFRTDPDIDPEEVVRAVFDLLTEKVSEGEIEDIVRIMPEELKGLWRWH